MSSFFKHRLVREILGLILWAAGIFLLLSLFSFHPSDPSSFNHLGSEVVQNLSGWIGAYLADLILSRLGAVAFLLPLALFFLGWGQIKLKSWKYSLVQGLGSILLILSGCSLLALIANKTGGRLYSQFPYGGAIGEPIIYLLLKYFNLPGAFLIILTLSIVSIILITRISWYDLVFVLINKAGQALGLGFRWLRDWIDTITDGCFRKRKGAEPDKEVSQAKSRSGKKKKKSKPKGSPSEGEKELEPAMSPSGQDPIPPKSLLDQPEKPRSLENKQQFQEGARKLEEKFLDFGVHGKVVQFYPGPVITRYEFEPAPGVKISKISNLSDDLALAMKAISVRIVAPVPGKSVVGLEIPNQYREKVYLREILESELFTAAQSKLSLALGKDIAGQPYITDLARMPHLLVAGATGAGKSVCINSVICSILFNAIADEVKFIMIDPKMLELGIYNSIPHLLAPVVMDPKEAASALRWATQEMITRYKLLSDKTVRNIDQYNQLIRMEGGGKEEEKKAGVAEDGEETVASPLPYIVIVIDEFADLMITSGREVETLLIRLAQMARAVGIHLIIATQRPSVDVVTGLIKANFPCRLSFRVSSKTDSRTILDTNGAERLLGHGDMLFLPPNSSELIRLHGSFITEVEIKRLVKYLSFQGQPEYNETILTFSGEGEEGGEKSGEDEYDDLYDKAVDLVIKTRQASISMIQRRLRIGYNRAARMIELMERDGVVSKPQGSKPREVLVGSEYEK